MDPVYVGVRRPVRSLLSPATLTRSPVSAVHHLISPAISGTRIAPGLRRAFEIGTMFIWRGTQLAGTSHAVGDVAFVLFALAQAFDGVFTYVGIVSFGHGVEANPLIAWYVAAYGAATAVIGAKVIAVACGAVLHFTAMHRTVAGLALLYAVAALWPWTLILWG
jgi:hypothetical protein